MNESKPHSAVESILAEDGAVLAYLVREDATAEHTSFVTDPDDPLQLGFVVYARGGEVVRHVHRPLERHLVGTAETVLVRSGRCDVDVYDDERRLVATRELRAGDAVLLLAGGHGFRMHEDTVLLELKQGPYTGLDEKERF